MVATTVAETRQLLEDYRDTGSTRAREQLVTNYVPLVRSLISRFRSSREPQEDLFQVGMIGILNAINKFDPNRGTSFSSLAIPEVLGAVLNYLRDHGSLLKVPRALRRNKLTLDRAAETLATTLGRWPTVPELADACDLSEEEISDASLLGRQAEPRSLDEKLDAAESDGGATLSECVGAEDRGFDLSLNKLALAAAMTILPQREKTILKLRFLREMSQRQIAERVNISQMHVSRLERSALRKLKSTMEARALPLVSSAPAKVNYRAEVPVV